MKNVLSVMVVLVLGVVLAGCSATPLTQGQVELQQAAISAKSDCYSRLAVRDTQIQTMLAKIPEDQVALVFVLQQMQENNKALMSIATGNQYDECSLGTTAFDVQIAEVQSKNAAASSITGSVLNLGKWIVGGYTAVQIADKVSGDTLNAYEGSEANVGSKNTTSVATSGLEAANSTPSSENQAPQSNKPAAVEEGDTEWTEDDPNCSVASRAAGRC